MRHYGCMREEYRGEWMARRYDEGSAELFAPEVVDPIVSFLADLAGERGEALELGVGTGRIAVPLSRQGVRVHGIDFSQDMVDRLRSRQSTQQIGVTIGDFTTADAGRKFRLAYLIYGTIEDLTTQDEQVRCFRNVARHLEPGGCFVLEAPIPPIRRLPPGETIQASRLSPDWIVVDDYNTAEQTCRSDHYRVTGGKLEILSARYRYVWPAELDLMARLAGMSLRERWGGWQRQSFDVDSTAHISVWERRA